MEGTMEILRAAAVGSCGGFQGRKRLLVLSEDAEIFISQALFVTCLRVLVPLGKFIVLQSKYNGDTSSLTHHLYVNFEVSLNHCLLVLKFYSKYFHKIN